MLGMDNGQVILLVTTIIGFLTTIIQMYLKHQNDRAVAREALAKLEADRRFDLEEREQARKDLEQKVLLAQREVVRATNQQTTTIVSKIDENTKMNEGALSAANNVNAKLQAIAGRFDRVDIASHLMSTLSPPILEEIKEVSEDTNVRVRGIENANDKT